VDDEGNAEFDERGAAKEFIKKLILQLPHILPVIGNRKKTIIYTQSVKHAEIVYKQISSFYTTGIVAGKNLSNKEVIIDQFKNGTIKVLILVLVGRVGLNVPDADTLIMLRATQVLSLYLQTAARVMTKCPGKTEGLYLDFGGNIQRHGPIDLATAPKRRVGGGVAPAKLCPNCAYPTHPTTKKCPLCGYLFTDAETPRLSAKKLTTAPVYGGVTSDELIYLSFDEVSVVKKRTKKGDNAIVLTFYQNSVPYPIATTYLLFWHASDSARARAASVYERIMGVAFNNKAAPVVVNELKQGLVDVKALRGRRNKIFFEIIELVREV